MPDSNAAVNLPSQSERREHERFRAVRYTAVLRKKSGFLLRKSFESAVENFHREGMAVHSDKRLKIGDILEVELSSASERISGLWGVVRNIRKEHLDYRYGIQFVESEQALSASPSAEDVLSCLEDVIKAQVPA